MTRKQQIEQAWLHGDAENLPSFRMGAEWADEHPQCPWTRLEDRWPIDEGRILAFEGKGGSSVYDVYSIGKGLYWDEYGKNDLDGDELHLILYWMKMPDLPPHPQK